MSISVYTMGFVPYLYVCLFFLICHVLDNRVGGGIIVDVAELPHPPGWDS